MRFLDPRKALHLRLVLPPASLSNSPSASLFKRGCVIVSSKSPRCSTRAMASWACSRCTFLNPPSQKSTCGVCLFPSSPPSLRSQPSSSSSSSLRWSCGACTFSNAPSCASCEVCGTHAAARRPLATFVDLDLEPDEISNPSVGSVFLPLQRCGQKRPPPLPPKPAAPNGVDDDGPEPAGWRRAEKSARNEEVVDLEAVGKGITLGHDGLNLSGWRKAEKMGRKVEDMEFKVVENVDLIPKQHELKILSYNVWFREDLEVYMRMKALGDIIEQHSPDLICLQEVTPNIYEIFQNFYWWKLYKCSVSPEMATMRGYFCMQLSKLSVKSFNCKPFSNSIMGRELCLADINLGEGKELVLATSHLESPCPAPPKWDQMFSKERVAQAEESVNLLKDSPNVVFCGDMNWDDKLDGAFPLPGGWVDAWMELKPGEDGWTYDTNTNQMLSGNRSLRKRLDRFICGLHDFKIESIQMVGMEAIPGLSHVKEKRGRGGLKTLVLPVLPSDHFGLLLTICSL